MRLEVFVGGIKMNARQFLQENSTLLSIGNCGICTKPITDTHPDEVMIVEGQPVHNDCYFQKLGELIENNPITSPRH